MIKNHLDRNAVSKNFAIFDLTFASIAFPK